MRRTVCVLLICCGFVSTAAAQQPGTTQAGVSAIGVVAPLPCQPLEAESEPAISDLYGESCDYCWFVGAEYLIWWLREGRLPPALTTSSTASQGVLGQPDTRILYGDDSLQTRHADRFVGGRLTIGYWFDPQQTLGIEGRAVFLERDSTHFATSSNGSELLALPYTNALNGNPQSIVIAGLGPRGLLSGGYNGYSRVEFFDQEVNLITPLLEEPGLRLELLAGARFLEMRDRTDLTASSKVLPAAAVVLSTADHLRAHDFFYGGQLGLRGEVVRGRWFVNARAEVALGGNDEQERNFGQTVFASPFQRVVQQGGLFVQPSNTGTFERTVLNGVYEIALNAGCRIYGETRFFVGYTLLMWDSPIRSGDQVDTVVNPTQFNGQSLVGPARPGVPFREDFFWAQGVNVGLEFRW
jgi:hypothetical protein